MTDRIAKTAAAEEYAAQIDEWVRQLSQPIPDEAGISSGVAGIDSRSLASEVRDFANECFDKRVEKILAFCPLTSWGTIPLREQVDRFLRETNSTAAESSRQGALRFLNWLEWECPLEPEDADRVACDCGWLLVEEKARLRRNDYLLFQERRLTNPFLIAGEDDWLRFRFLADPTRVDLVLVSSLFLEGKSLPPATKTEHQSCAS